MTVMLIEISDYCVNYWYTIPLIPTGVWLLVKLIRKFRYGRAGWDTFTIKMPVFGQIVEKNIVARTTRTLGTLVASGVPILEALNITRETSGNAVFERMYQKVYDSIREGESISKPMKEFSRPQFNVIDSPISFERLYKSLADCGSTRIGWFSAVESQPAYSRVDDR